MTEYLVELYVAQGDHDAAQQYAERAERAGQEMAREGQPVRCLSSIFVSEDETCFLLYEADSAELVAEANAAVGTLSDVCSPPAESTCSIGASSSIAPCGAISVARRPIRARINVRRQEPGPWICAMVSNPPPTSETRETS